jgi:hypothetical protein
MSWGWSFACAMVIPLDKARSITTARCVVILLTNLPGPVMLLPLSCCVARWVSDVVVVYD